MNIYSTEDEQITALKKWWKENGTAILLGLAIALGGVFGYQAWQKSEQQNAAEASALYQEMAALVANSREELSDEQKSTLVHLADRLKSDFSGSGYAPLAGLFKAGHLVKEGDLDGAKNELLWVLEQDLDASLEKVVRLRLARVTFDGSKETASQALALIDDVDAGTFTASYEDVKGDLYLALEQTDQARDAYQKSVDAAREAGQSRPLTQLKLNDLAVEQEGA